jgi:hypothetical protein
MPRTKVKSSDIEETCTSGHSVTGAIRQHREGFRAHDRNGKPLGVYPNLSLARAAVYQQYITDLAGAR